jgi:chromosome segregation ATPase
MNRPYTFLSLACLVACIVTVSLRAAEPADAESRLREALRSTALQLRDAQGQVASSQASQAEAERQVEELKEKNDRIAKAAAASQAEMEKTIATLKTRVAEQDEMIVRYKDAVEKYETAYKQAVGVATKTEAERASLADQKLQLERKVVQREAQNVELFKVGSEILTRYAKFSLGEAIAAREPFVGLTRVKLENQVQDYHEQLLEHKVRAEN